MLEFVFVSNEEYASTEDIFYTKSKKNEIFYSKPPFLVMAIYCIKLTLPNTLKTVTK